MSHPLDQQFGELVRHHQLRTVPPLRAEVLGQSGDKLELRLLLREDLKALWGLDAGLQNVPLAPFGGWALTLSPGAHVRVEFLGGDVGDPLAAYLSGPVVQAQLDATVIKVGPAATSIDLGAATKPVASSGAGVTVALAGPTAGKGVVDVPVQTVVKV